MVREPDTGTNRGQPIDDSGAVTGTAEDWQSIPDRLKNIDRWLMWSAAPDVPRRPHWKGDFSVSYNDPDDWHTFDEAVEATQEKDEWGIGFVTGDDVQVIDIDGGIDEIGDARDWLPGLSKFKRSGDVYAEWSPSRTGWHVPVEGIEDENLDWTDRAVEDAEHQGVDVLKGQFCTVTGVTPDEFNGDRIAPYDVGVYGWLMDVADNIDSLNATGPGGLDNDLGSDGWSPSNEWLTAEDIQDALSHINADCSYQKWRQIGFAVGEFFFDEDVTDQENEDSLETGEELLVEWSKTADEQWDAQAEAQARRFIRETPDRLSVEAEPVTVGALIYHAQQAGWEMPSPPASVKAMNTLQEQAEMKPKDVQPGKVWSSAADLTDEAYDAWRDTIARIVDQSVDQVDRHRELAQHDDDLIVEDNKIKQIVVCESEKRFTRELVDFALDVHRFVNLPDGPEVADVTITPAQNPDKQHTKEIEPAALNQVRDFKEALMNRTFDTTISAAHVPDGEVVRKVKKWIGRQDVPRLTGQNAMGLSPAFDEFVLPTGTIGPDGWMDEPDTAFYSRDFAFEDRVVVSPDDHEDIDEDAVAEMIELLCQTRNPERGIPIYSWMYSVAFKRQIMDAEGQFNTLAVSGETGSGKSALLSVLTAMFGMSGDPSNIEDSKWAFKSKFLTSVGVPVWFDEYKRSDTPDWVIKRVHTHLRNTTSGEVVESGNSDMGTDGYPLRSPVVISGEDQVKGSAEERRSIMVDLLRHTTEDDNRQEAFKALAGEDFIDDDGAVNVADADRDLATHAAAYYQHVTGLSEDEFHTEWRTAKEYAVEKIAEWGHEDAVSDMEMQGLQTIVFGFNMMQSFAEEVGVDMEELPGLDELDKALRHVAPVGDDERQDHLDRYVRTIALAALDGQLEEETHFTVVKEGKPGEELRVNLNRAHDKVIRYIEDHSADVDVLSSVRDYKTKIKERIEHDDTGPGYVVRENQNSHPIGRATGFNMHVADEEIPGFDRGIFVGEVEGEDVERVPAETIGEDDIGNTVTVTETALIGWQLLGSDSKAHAVGTISAGDEPSIDVVAFDTVDIPAEPPMYVEIENVDIGEWKGDVQVQVTEETSIHEVEATGDEQLSIRDECEDEDSDDGFTVDFREDVAEESGEAAQDAARADGGVDATDDIVQRIVGCTGPAATVTAVRDCLRESS